MYDSRVSSSESDDELDSVIDAHERDLEDDVGTAYIGGHSRGHAASQQSRHSNWSRGPTTSIESLDQSCCVGPPCMRECNAGRETRNLC